MSQSKNPNSSIEINISNLEEYYMNLIKQEFTSQIFVNDLNNMKSYIQNNYNFIANNYDKKNKIDVAIERLIRKHIYSSQRFNIIAPYYSPLSSDVAFETSDAIINIDSKTIDEVGNSSDISYFHFEANQCSFKNKGLGAGSYNVGGTLFNFNGVEVKTTLPTIDPDTKKPLLTYVIRLIYRDDKVRFNFANRQVNFSITCLPNGELSSLFNNDLVCNFKTYEYNKPTSSYQPIFLTGNTTHNFIPGFINTLGIHIPFNYSNASLKTKIGLFDGQNLWVPVKRTGKVYSPKGFYLEIIKNGHTARIKYTDLISRYDRNGNIWDGHLEYKI